MLKPKIDNNIKIQDFVQWELEYFRANCNFSSEEMQYFNLRSCGKSNIEISFEMHISESKVSKLARKVKFKMLRVI